MIIENYTTVRQNLKSFCDKVAEEQVDLLITRTNHDDVVMMSLERYGKILELEKILELVKGQETENGKKE